MAQKTKGPQERYRAYLRAELDGAALFSTLAKAERDPHRAQVFQGLSQAEVRHASHWAQKLGMKPEELRVGRSGVRARLLGWLARLLGTRFVVSLLVQGEYREIRAYSTDQEASGLVADEQYAARALGSMGRALVPAGGVVRAAVLGVNDGLVSNFALIMGVAGGTGDQQIILLAGIAGLLAGAFSMAAGEYVSMRAQRDLYEHQIELERVELQEFPQEERRELELIYQAKGLTEEEAKRVASRIIADPEVALDTKVREELGLSPAQLGSPWGATSSSFVSFALGALVPVVPFLTGASGFSLLASGLGSGLGLLAVGGLMAKLSGKSAWWGGVRMVLIGASAAAVTFAIGSLVGVALD